MKKALLLLMLTMSMNAFAIVCESDENPGKKIKLVTQVNNLVSGESFIRTIDNLFVGTVKKEFFKGDTYKLYNQKGQEFTFFHKKELVLNNHCRTRVCPAPTPTPIGPSLGKLSTEGLEDEYFSCF